MPGPVARSALLVAGVLAAALGVVGALALRGPGVIALLVTAALVGATTAGMVRETPGADRSGALDAGARAAAWTAGALLVLAGLAALAGAVVTVLVGGVVAAVVIAVRLRRVVVLRRVAESSRPAPAAAGRSDGPTLLAPPVGGLSARSLGEEWLRTTALLDARLDPVVRRAVVARRESLLDELERRDPAGFTHWLAAAPAATSDPAEHVRDIPAAGSSAA